MEVEMKRFVFFPVAMLMTSNRKTVKVGVFGSKSNFIWRGGVKAMAKVIIKDIVYMELNKLAHQDNMTTHALVSKICEDYIKSLQPVKKPIPAPIIVTVPQLTRGEKKYLQKIGA